MEIKEQVLQFLSKCEDLKNGKFIVATSKISEILKCIAANEELYLLFKETTKNFNYAQAKQRYLVTSYDGVIHRSYVALPDTMGDRLAFIFCLFVEFDRNTLNFGEFIKTYYNEGGGYYAGYVVFCNQVVQSLMDIVTEVFAEELNKEDEVVVQEAPDTERAEALTKLGILVNAEIEHISSTDLSEEDKQCGIRMINQILANLGKNDAELLDALISGYTYFVMFHNIVGTTTDELCTCFMEVSA